MLFLRSFVSTCL